jgi:type III pantothenate kinase
VIRSLTEFRFRFVIGYHNRKNAKTLRKKWFCKRRKTMELLFKAGNTHTVMGIAQTDKTFKIWRIDTKNLATEDEIFSHLYTLFQFAGIDLAHITQIGVASVVPSVNYSLQRLGEKYFQLQTVFVNCQTRIFDIAYQVDYPQEIGADRLANVITAKKEYGDQVIVVDFGTVITLDVIQQGNFVGGAILPGFQTAMMALFSNTAKLPQVELRIPDYLIGVNTVDNIQIGILKITLLGIERWIEAIRHTHARDYAVVCTGGLGKFFQGNSWLFERYDPDLTLKGICYFLQYAQ